MLIGPAEAQERISNNEMEHKKDASTGRDLWFYVEEHLEHKAVAHSVSTTIVFAVPSNAHCNQRCLPLTCLCQTILSHALG